MTDVVMLEAIRARLAALPLPTVAERRRQLISLAYGNLKLEDPRVTRSTIEQAVCALVDAGDA